MKEEFHVVTTQDYPAFQVMIRVWMPLYHPTKGWWFFGGAVLLAAILWAMLNFSSLSLPLAWAIRAAILFICLAVARPARRGLERRLCRTLGKRTYESARNKDAKVEYACGKDRILVRDQFGQSELKYSAITEAAETEDYFLLFLGERVCHILSKSGFVMGKPEQFAQFLRKATGKSVRTFVVTGGRKKKAK